VGNEGGLLISNFDWRIGGSLAPRGARRRFVLFSDNCEHFDIVLSANAKEGAMPDTRPSDLSDLVLDSDRPIPYSLVDEPIPYAVEPVLESCAAFYALDDEFDRML